MEQLLRIIAGLDVRTILDIGCGSGVNLSALARQNRYELTGAEVSKKALELAKRNVPTARLLILDAAKECLPETFDLVISVQVVEHVPDDLSFLKHMTRMARKYVLVSTMKGRMRRSELGIGHVRNYSEVELMRKLEMTGLSAIRIFKWGFPFYSPLYRTISEFLPGGPPVGPMGRLGRLGSQVLYELYRFNIPNRGDVITALGTVPARERDEISLAGASR